MTTRQYEVHGLLEPYLPHAVTQSCHSELACTKRNTATSATCHTLCESRTQGSPTNGDKMRLLLCYLATHPGRFDDASRERWAQLAQLPQRDMDTICNVAYLGVELKKDKRSKFTFMSGAKKAKKARAERAAADAQLLENGRFQPLIADTVNALVAGKLERGPDKEWDVVEASNEFEAVSEAGGTAAASVGAKSMRTTKKPTWHKRGASSSGSGQGGVLGVEQVGLRSRVVVRRPFRHLFYCHRARSAAAHAHLLRCWHASWQGCALPLCQSSCMTLRTESAGRAGGVCDWRVHVVGDPGGARAEQRRGGGAGQHRPHRRRRPLPAPSRLPLLAHAAAPLRLVTAAASCQIAHQGVTATHGMPVPVASSSGSVHQHSFIWTYRCLSNVPLVVHFACKLDFTKRQGPALHFVSAGVVMLASSAL